MIRFTTKGKSKNPDCNCQPIAVEGDGQEWTIDFCAKHENVDKLREALASLVEYTYSILTGPIMQQAGVIWPDGKPQSPVLKAAESALEAAAEGRTG